MAVIDNRAVIDDHNEERLYDNTKPESPERPEH